MFANHGARAQSPNHMMNLRLSKKMSVYLKKKKKDKGPEKVLFLRMDTSSQHNMKSCIIIMRKHNSKYHPHMSGEKEILSSEAAW